MSETVVSKRYSMAKQVLDNHQYLEAPVFEGCALDATTAGVLVAVYEALSPKNQAKFDDIPLGTLIDFCWKQVTPQGGRTHSHG